MSFLLEEAEEEPNHQNQTKRKAGKNGVLLEGFWGLCVLVECANMRRLAPPSTKVLSFRWSSPSIHHPSSAQYISMHLYRNDPIHIKLMKRLCLKPIMVLSPPKSIHKLQRWISRLHKIKTWTSLSTRFKLHKSGGVGGGGGRGSGGGGVEYDGDCDQVGGLLKLRDDVEMCGYRDVEVMWNMLSMQSQPVKATARSTKRGSRHRHRFLCRLFFRTNHHP